jgi:hypothetical protein
MDWSRTEVELVVSDYFAMLREELADRPVDKSSHRRALQPLLNNRSEGSIEFKHQNISAVLINFDQPYINGYKPRQNYQGLLEQVVLEFGETDRQLVQVTENSVVLNPAAPPRTSFENVMSLVVEPPEAAGAVAEQRRGARPPIKGVDYVMRDAKNRALGENGEQWAQEFERRRLHDVERRPDLAQRVEWVAQTRGDGLGYDIASFNGDESPRLIEVKTTGLGKYFPFYVTENELRVSQSELTRYHLYRVFDFAKEPHLYQLNGALSDVCRLEPTIYRARVG